MKSTTQSPFSERLSAGMSLKEFVESAVSEQTNNHMCRCIAGIPPESGMNIKATWLYELALHNLERHYELIGTVECIDQTFAKFATLLGWGRFAIPVDNVTTGSHPELDDRTLETVREFNELDLRLYEHVSTKIRD
jgi:hypothetical protein